jgi:lysophospholipase L1-like esterase
MKMVFRIKETIWMVGCFEKSGMFRLNSGAGVEPGVRAEPPRKIAVFGSSVASGGADEPAQRGGYAGRLKELLETGGWSLVNVSQGGDNTVSIQPRVEEQLFPQKPGYVLIGLSLGNEGLAGASTVPDREKIYHQFQSGLQKLIRWIRGEGMRPVVGLCYANSAFDSEQYEYTRRTNLTINGWDVPSINFLGAIDDGQGKWTPGCESDAGHPNSQGHEEMFYAIVPTLFDAMAAGKPVPRRVSSEGFVRVNNDSRLSFRPRDTIHSFAVGFQCRTAGEGVIASVKHEEGRIELDVKDGKLLYRTVEGGLIPVGDIGRGAWVQVVLSHRYAKGETLIFVDGNHARTVLERVAPMEFVLGGSKEADYRQWLVYRSSLNADEVKALYEGKFVQASLEIYSPLVEKSLRPENLAQSLSTVEVVNKENNTLK